MAAQNAALCYLAEHSYQAVPTLARPMELNARAKVATCEPQAGERLYRWPAPW
ncbi:MAG TPA: hypothetical protein PL071_11680 [Nitrosomonas sp.]|nr:hypothetical protein [Nitrosomonas sp.]